ncbi:MAG: CheY-like chemotaxis protein/two-component sensor histidine kinase [bacterium]|jgi:CheY-like chemotaxis protein/two-component sensor histidine kinase
MKNMFRILIVDDSPVVRKLIRKDLEKGDLELDIWEASDGPEALVLLSEVKPDLITLDVEMPDLDGYQVCKKIRNLTDHPEFAEIPVLFVTSSDTVEERAKGFQAGATDFVTKPFIEGEISNAATKILVPKNELVGITVLVVDDSKTARRHVSSFLHQEGLNVIEAENGKIALHILKHEKDSIDMVITDLEMPEMNGDELCRNLRQKIGNKELPVIFLTGVSDREAVLEIFKAGATDYIVKPFVKEELFSRLNIHLRNKLLKDELQENIVKLKRASKLKDDFLAIASHDLRSPLNGVLGFAGLLLDNPKFVGEEKEFLEHIETSGKFLLSLINDILDLSRLQSENEDLDLKPLPIYSIVKSCAKTLAHMASPKGIKLSIINRCSKQNFPLIVADKNAIARITNNLLSNAIKFTPKKGFVKIILEVVDSNLEFTIQDSGIGIPQDKIPFLFDKFTKASQAGTEGEKSIGLGMSITKDLVELQNGNIIVESEVNVGTKFCVQIPLYSEEKKEEKIVDNSFVQRKINHTGQIRALLVEDNPFNVKLAKLILGKMKYHVDFVDNGQKAVENYKKFLYENNESCFYDFYLMDLNMPVMDGYESTQYIRKEEEGKNIHLPIIAMTASTDIMEKEKCFDVGMDDYVTKPIVVKKLTEAINKILKN